MSKNIADKTKRILKGMDFDLELAFNWSNQHYDNYYEYFAHSDRETRKYALLIFAGGLGNWRLESAQIFRPIEEQKTDGDFDETKCIFLRLTSKHFLNIESQFNKNSPYCTIR